MNNKLHPLLLTLFLTWGACADDLGIIGERALRWRTDQIAQVIAGGDYMEGGKQVTLDGRQCMEGTRFNFNVDDHYAFDIDETVQSEVEFYVPADDVVAYLAYEKNGDGEVRQKVRLPRYSSGRRSVKKAFTLERARF